MLALPWASGNIAAGPFEEDRVQAGWQVLAAFYPGVAGEAWARVFVIAALYLAVTPLRPGLGGSAGLRRDRVVLVRLPARPINPNVVVLMGTIQVLPISLAGAGIRLLAAAALIFVPSMIWRGWDGAATWSPDLALALALLAALLLADAAMGIAVTVRRAHHH